MLSKYLGSKATLKNKVEMTRVYKKIFIAVAIFISLYGTQYILNFIVLIIDKDNIRITRNINNL